jgi:hypothetical protein
MNGPPSEIPTYYSTKEVPLKRAIRTLFGRNCVFFFFFCFVILRSSSCFITSPLDIMEVPTCLFAEVFLTSYSLVFLLLVFLTRYPLVFFG